MEIASGLARDNYNMYVCLYECVYIYIHTYIETRKGYKGHAAAVGIYCRHFKLCDASGGGCAIRIENAGGRIICPKRIRLMCARYNIYYSVFPATRHMCGGALPGDPRSCVSRLIAGALGFPVFWKIA